MSIGPWAMVLAFAVTGALTAWGVRQTKRNILKGKKYITGFILFLTGAALGIGYVLFAKRIANPDLIISWLILAMGCMAAASVALLVGFYSEKNSSK